MFHTGKTGRKTSRKAFKSSVSALGLVAGAIGWSGLANAASEETERQTFLLPDHYQLMNDGVVVFNLQTGEQLSLDPNQYLILEDGLLLITDELAQASIESLPVMGAIRSPLMSDVQPIRSPDGSAVLATDSSPLWSGDGPAPRVFEQVDIQRYELAQSEQGSLPETNGADMSSVAGTGLSLAALGLGSGFFQNKTEETPATEETPSADTGNSAPTIDFSSFSNVLTFPDFYSSLYDLSPFISDPDNDDLTMTIVSVTSNDVNNDDPAVPGGDYTDGVYYNPFVFGQIGSNNVNLGFNGGYEARLAGDDWTIVLQVSDGTLTTQDTLIFDWGP